MILAHDNIPLYHETALLYCGDVFLNMDHYFMGIEDTRPGGIMPGNLTRVDGNASNGLVVDLPKEIGYLVILVPVGVRPFNRWYVRSNNKGYIGGSISDPFTNLFPAPVAVRYGDDYYRAYVSSYITQVNSPMTLFQN